MAASLGDKMAQYYTGLYLYGGIGTDKDYQRAFYWISKSAQQGYLDAQETLSALYRKGIGTSADPERADYWHDVWQRQLREQQAESQRPGIDSIQDALDTVFGGDSYPGQKCGWSYQAYIHFRPKDPCAGRPSK
jgi:TPR repeat protein